MADNATKQQPATFSGPSKALRTDYPLIDNDPYVRPASLCFQQRP
ncbi:hypothetical protein GMORB2_4734 [Geosmithia morbida]|uniref:Uncharacterized protein n=1 Tax=Geosmithia morbida TaxID=1094350 RepID=A0A9P4YPL6_9HYPO|nr:uncharacterized protein GMORB2_4734 [Geosmithia morbida]KAF4119469.1 hypothetical protein GMORB2_4734 [Geosmithia morbida]